MRQTSIEGGYGELLDIRHCAGLGLSAGVDLSNNCKNCNAFCKSND